MSALAVRADAIFAAAEEQPMPTDDRGRWALPDVIGAEELLKARLAPRCIVKDYLFADVAALVAQGGTGKTTMSLAEKVCIALGRPVWGLPVREPGPSLIVTAEDRREFLVARLRRVCEAMRLSPAELDTVRSSIRIHDCTADVRQLTAVVQDVVVVTDFSAELVGACKRSAFAPAIVEFDPMVSFGVGESRVNDAEQGLVHAARAISVGLDCAVRYVHHTGKAAGRERMQDQYAGRGGSALADGSRMVHVLTPVNDAELYKATGERLTNGQSAFALARPKISYAPPQPVLYIRREGYAFDVLRAVEAPSTQERQRLLGEQLARYLAAELQRDRRHTRNTLESIRPENMSRADVRAGLAWLSAAGRLHEAPVVLDGGKRPATGARSYLVADGEPRRSERA